MKNLLLLALALGSAPAARAASYEIDPEHSGVSFRIRHLGGKVRGRFDRFQGSFDYAPGKPAAWRAEARIEAASINTNVAARDKHLRGEDFFDVENCSQIAFKSGKVERLKDGKTRLHGDLTIRCTTRPIVLNLEIGEEMKDPWGNTKLSATAEGKVNRKDFGLNWNKALDKGGLLLGEEVEMLIEIEAGPKQ